MSCRQFGVSKKAMNTVPEGWNTGRPWEFKSVKPIVGQQLRLFRMSYVVSKLKVLWMINVYPRCTNKQHPNANKWRWNAAWKMPNL
jgi:hypothetical protein